MRNSKGIYCGIYAVFGAEIVKSEAKLKRDLKVTHFIGQIVAFFDIISCILEYPSIDTVMVHLCNINIVVFIHK